VLLGEHIFKEASSITGGPGVGRRGTVSTFFGGRFDVDGAMFGIEMTRSQKVYLLVLVVLVVLGVIARNVGRSDLGRAFSAVRDRDIAAEVIGVDLTRAKVLAFVIGSFYAGVAGALLVTVNEFFDPGSFNLLLSIRFIAMILIGGVATISGAIMGAVFIALLPRISFELVEHLPEAAGLSPSVVEGLLYGTLLIGFLIVEPRGLFGLWFRIRNYWKAWPFSY
jgi:branched-chain amino acid transport system permease protein